MSSGPMLTPAYHSELLGTKEVSPHRSTCDAPAVAQNEDRKGKFGRFRSPLLAKHQKRRAENLCVSHVGDKVQLSIDFPGVKASDLIVRVENRVLSISGMRHVQTDHGGIRRIEHHRRFHLDRAIDSEHIEANLSHGVLSLIAPLRRKPTHPISIPVSTRSTHGDVSKRMDTEHPVDAGTYSGNDGEVAPCNQPLC